MITRFRIKDHWAEQRMFMRRALAAGVIMLALMLVLVVKLVHLQVIRYDYYAELSQGNRVRIEAVPPNRGLILDRNGAVLAENLPAYQLELTAEQVPDIDAALQRLSALALVVPEDIPRLKRLIRSRRTFEGVPIRLQLSDEEVARFAVRRHDFPGIDIKTRLTRHYPLGELAVHALGYVAAISEQDLAHIDKDEYAGTSLIGKIGLEASYESELHGEPGYRQVLVNAQGRPVERASSLKADLSTKPAASGNDLILSLDVNLQRVAEEALRGKRGAAVAIDPNNGEVLAFVSMPGFDPHLFGRGLTRAEYKTLTDDIDIPLYDRVLRGVYPSASTIKPFMGLAGLNYHAISPADHKFCTGLFHLPGVARPWRDWKPKGHGSVDMRRAIATSCDVYFYGLAASMGIDRIHDFLAQFGFGTATGIDVEGEQKALLPSTAWKRRAFRNREAQVWYPGDTVSVGIGQGYLTVTPLQLAHATATLAMKGQRFRPRLVHAIRDARTGAVKTLPPVPLEPAKTRSPNNWEVVREGMEAVMKPGGTAFSAAGGAPYSMAGKTGTAQVYSVPQHEKYNAKQIAERLRDHGLFIAFAPTEAPKIAVAVVIENGEHGTAAAPVARKIMDRWLLGEAAAKLSPTVTSSAGDDE